MRHPFEFDIEKGIESVLYIIENGTQPTFHHISKVMYFADKEHLEKYGRFICGDSYVAMKHGPVPSGIYDLLKSVRGDLFSLFSPSQEITEKVRRAFSVHGRYGVSVLRKADTELFSDSDTECLNNSINSYGNLSFIQLTSLSHDNAWKAADENDFMEIDHIIAAFDNKGDLAKHLRDPHPGEAN